MTAIITIANVDNDNDNDNDNAKNWKNKTLLVVRTKHMNDDWISANRYLGQDDPTISIPTYKVCDILQYDDPLVVHRN